jgi:hypothetical protein
MLIIKSSGKGRQSPKTTVATPSPSPKHLLAVVPEPYIRLLAVPLLWYFTVSTLGILNHLGAKFGTVLDEQRHRSHRRRTRRVLRRTLDTLWAEATNPILRSTTRSASDSSPSATLDSRTTLFWVSRPRPNHYAPDRPLHPSHQHGQHPPLTWKCRMDLLQQGGNARGPAMKCLLTATVTNLKRPNFSSFVTPSVLDIVYKRIPLLCFGSIWAGKLSFETLVQAVVAGPTQGTIRAIRVFRRALTVRFCSSFIGDSRDGYLDPCSAT